MADAKFSSAGERIDASTPWETIHASPEFRQLVEKKKRFLVPAVIFFLVYYFLLPSFAGWAKPLMAVKIFGPVNFGYLFALSQFAMVWVICWLYVRKASEFDAMSEQVARKVKGGGA